MWEDTSSWEVHARLSVALAWWCGSVMTGLPVMPMNLTLPASLAFCMAGSVSFTCPALQHTALNPPSRIDSAAALLCMQ